VHERGSAWNLSSKRGFILKFIVWKSDLVLANSMATKALIEKKFGISKNKIKVIHNGVNTSIRLKKKSLENEKTFFVGFIGRLDTPKGVHILISAMHNLKYENIKLIIAGDGPLKQDLANKARNLKNIQFIGRVSDPYKFFNTISLLVVPSIREPLGNVCLEAGLYRVPVLAANVDGLPEIIENKISGELIDATDQISIDLPEGSIPLPEFVVNPDIYELQPPKQINSSLLAKKILELSMSPDKLKYYADNLHNKVTKYFNIHRYRTDLHKIYSEIYFMDNF
jgi:glycosyltransferase involved in cell wall biosynthesis